jgi:hypothetical protein
VLINTFLVVLQRSPVTGDFLKKILLREHGTGICAGQVMVRLIALGNRNH